MRVKMFSLREKNVSKTLWALVLVLLSWPPVPSHGLKEELMDIGKAIELLVKYGLSADPERAEAFTFLWQDLIPTLYHQRPGNENGTKAEFKDYNLADNSNDDARFLTGQELIVRSGFKYEVFDAIADDGYITELTHLINPLADKTKLRQPPVLMEHGGTIDPTAYMIASSIQHFPEKWPRSMAQDGPIQSWNRSLAFVLANNGFDVWLAETRGANERNRRHIKTEAVRSILEGKNMNKNMTKGENINQILRSWDYWAFSQDDIIAHELKSHVDTVLQVTGAKKVHLMTFSLSTPCSLGFFSLRPDYAEKVQGYISMAPIISGQGGSKFTGIMFKTVCNLFPNHLGNVVFTEAILSEPMRRLVVAIFKPKWLRYSLGKALINYFMGPSAKWQTLLDDNVMGHLFRTVSFREVKQMCQHMKSNKFRKFDYGPVKNLLIYNQTSPPTYDLSNLNIRDWLVVSAANDEMSTPEVYSNLYASVNPKPVAHVVAPGFNHLDLIAGWGNDKYVNMPILRYLERMSFQSGTEENTEDNDADSGRPSGPYTGSSRSRTFDLKAMFPAQQVSPFDKLQAMADDLYSGGDKDSDKTPGKLYVPRLLEQLTKSLEKLANSVSPTNKEANQTSPSSYLTSGVKQINELIGGADPSKLFESLNLSDVLNKSLSQLSQVTGDKKKY